MTRRAHLPLALGAGVLALAWIGPLPELARASYAAHMALHMSVVALGVPLIAYGLTRSGYRLWGASPMLAAAATLVEFAVIWAWHAPALHEASRASWLVMTVEQASFAGAALLLWVPALSGPALAGAVALFMTAMHMALLGVLVSLAPRHIQRRDGTGLQDGALTLMQDQQLGGVIMIVVAGAVYGVAALWRASEVLRPSQDNVS